MSARGTCAKRRWKKYIAQREENPDKALEITEKKKRLYLMAKNFFNAMLAELMKF